MNMKVLKGRVLSINPKDKIRVLNSYFSQKLPSGNLLVHKTLYFRKR